MIAPRDMTAGKVGEGPAPLEEEPWHVRLTEDDPAGYVARWDDLTAEDAELIFTSCKMSALGFSLFLLHGSQVVRRKGRYQP